MLYQHILQICNILLFIKSPQKEQKEVFMADLVKAAMLYSTLIITINAFVVILVLVIEIY